MRRWLQCKRDVFGEQGLAGEFDGTISTVIISDSYRATATASGASTWILLILSVHIVMYIMPLRGATCLASRSLLQPITISSLATCLTIPRRLVHLH